MKSKTKVLFFAEAVTLAHVSRPFVLASGLDPDRYEVHFAHHPRYRTLFGDLLFTEHEIHSIAPQQFVAALSKGKPLYDSQTLSSYVEEDLALIESIQPDVVVGDFRLSLAVSAEVAKVPYVALSNAYWSPYTKQKYPVPELPIVEKVGPGVGQVLFNMVRPAAFFKHTWPLNRVRRAHGLSSLGGDLRRIYTWADYTLYADIPDLYNFHGMPDNHRFIGPIVWSPEAQIPPWWGDIPLDKPIIYVTLGSSGEARLLPGIAGMLSTMDLTTLISTAGAELNLESHDNVFVANFLPGDMASSLADLVICNGGSPTTHQALSVGVPIVGIPRNLDQYLNMQAIEAHKAGAMLRSGRLNPHSLRLAITEVQKNTRYKSTALGVANLFKRYDSSTLFQECLGFIV